MGPSRFHHAYSPLKAYPIGQEPMIILFHFSESEKRTKEQMILRRWQKSLASFSGGALKVLHVAHSIIAKCQPNDEVVEYLM